MIDREDLGLLKNILSLHNDNVDFEFLYKVLTVTKDYPTEQETLFDSFSNNQFNAKLTLVDSIKKLNILTKESKIVIFGSWYGSILIPAFYKDVKKIILVDMDSKVIDIAKNRLFNHLTNIEYFVSDIFEEFKDQYLDTDLFINTSCEHMLPMKEWGPWPKYANPWWGRVSPSHFAFQSNDMFDIPTHINCVHTIEQFKSQLPSNASVLHEEEIDDTRGVRFTLIGKLCEE